MTIQMNKCRLVPVEPTPEMIDAAREHHEGEAYLPVSVYKAMIAAAPAVQVQPVAYAVFADNGNIRMWCADLVQVETLRQRYGELLQPLYTDPQHAPDVTILVEALALCRHQASYSISDNESLSRQLARVRDVVNDALAAYRKQGGDLRGFIVRDK